MACTCTSKFGGTVVWCPERGWTNNCPEQKPPSLSSS